MTAPWFMVMSTLLFATMAVCVKLASQQYDIGEIVFYRSIVGSLMMLALTRWRRGSLRTAHLGMHVWRSLVGIAALSLWFYAIGQLPLATAMTLNYLSPVWMTLFLMGSAWALRRSKVDIRLLGAVLLGFAGVAMILRPTIEARQFGVGVVGLLSGMLAAAAYLQVNALGRVGEPEYRVVFYFSLGGVVAGATTLFWTGLHPHTTRGALLLLAIGVLATLAQWFLTRAYRTGRALVNASLQYTGIAFSFIYGVWLFDEPISAWALAGVALIVLAGLRATRLRERSAPLPIHSSFDA